MMLINLSCPLKALTSAVITCSWVQGSTAAAEDPFSVAGQMLEGLTVRAISGSNQLYGSFCWKNPCFCWVAYFCFCSVPQVSCKADRKGPRGWTESLKLPNSLQHSATSILFLAHNSPILQIYCWNWLKSTADVARPELQITLPDWHVGSAFWQQWRKNIITFVTKRNADGSVYTWSTTTIKYYPIAIYLIVAL